MSHQRSPSRVLVNSVHVPPRPWARVLALNEVYRSRCRGEDGLYKRMTARQEGYVKGILKNLGPDTAEAIVEATKSYVLSLASLDVAKAVQKINDDAGYKRRA